MYVFSTFEYLCLTYCIKIIILWCFLLSASLDTWQQDGVRGVWAVIDLKHSHFIPVFVEVCMIVCIYKVIYFHSTMHAWSSYQVAAFSLLKSE